MESKNLAKKIGDLNREIQEFEKDRERLILDFENKIRNNKTEFDQQIQWLREQKEKLLEQIQTLENDKVELQNKIVEMNGEVEKTNNRNEEQLSIINNMKEVVKTKMTQIKDLQH